VVAAQSDEGAFNMSSFEVTFEDIQRAAERIKGMAQRTPVMTSHAFNEKSGVDVVFKCENFQKGGAFKIRGAANFLYSIRKDDLPRGVVAYSSGNHAQAVAIAAKSVGAPATLVMPEDAPRSKMEATRAQGPRIITFDRFKDDRDAIGAKISAETGAALVPPYDHPWTMAGAGTTALEFLEQVPDLDALVICIGGGGLIAGCSIAAKHLKPSIHIFGVEPANASDTYQSFESGRRVKIPAPDTIADGLRSPSPGELTFPVIQKNVEKIVLVSEDEIRATVKFLLTRMKILVEPSGAVSAAAAMFGKLPSGLGRVGIVLSGGNVDLDQLAGF
jgi:threonine dehydratase